MPMQCFIRVKSQFRENNLVLPTEFPSLVLPCNAIMLQQLIQFSLCYPSRGCLQEVKKRKFQTFSSKSDRDRLREVFTYKRFQILYSDLTRKLLVFWKLWSLGRGGRLQELVATGGNATITLHYNTKRTYTSWV